MSLVSIVHSLRELLARSQGLLFSDHLIEIGVAIERHEMICVVNFFLGNKTPSPFTALRVELQSPNSRLLQIQALQAPTEIDAYSQVMLPFSLQSHGPFDFLPSLHISFLFSDATAFALELHAPLPVTLFTEGWHLSEDELRLLWNNTKFEVRNREVDGVSSHSIGCRSIAARIGLALGDRKPSSPGFGIAATRGYGRSRHTRVSRLLSSFKRRLS